MLKTNWLQFNKTVLSHDTTFKLITERTAAKTYLSFLNLSVTGITKNY